MEVRPRIGRQGSAGSEAHEVAGVVVLPTGAWYDPADPARLEVHGNPNVLTRDVGTSTLAQGTSAHSCLVEVERYDGALPDVKAFSQPPMTGADRL